MPTIKVGALDLTDIRRGATYIAEVRRGSTLVWQRVTIADEFDRADAATLGASWTEHGTLPGGGALTYQLGVENNTARSRVPEGMIGGFFSLNTSRMRYNADTAPQDDGYVECVPASRGDGATGGSPGGYVTDVFRRLSNGAFTDGVGIRLSSGQCSIVRRVAGVDDVMAACGSFQPGDVLRLNQAVNDHRLYRNGVQVGRWNDSGATAHKGASYRSLGIRADGAKDLLGPRRFSPALDYVVMG